MLTRILLLVSLLLGVVAPPHLGHAEHCGGPAGSMTAGTEMAMMDHTGPAPAPQVPVTPDHRHHHCPPVDCAMTVHCAPAHAAIASVGFVTPVLGTSHFALGTSPAPAGRDLEPPTPPPNRSL